MKRYVITQCLDLYMVWKKTFWGWRQLKEIGSRDPAYMSFKSIEDAERYIRKIESFRKFRFPIVKELNFPK